MPTMFFVKSCTSVGHANRDLVVAKSFTKAFVQCFKDLNMLNEQFMRCWSLGAILRVVYYLADIRSDCSPHARKGAEFLGHIVNDRSCILKDRL